MIIILRILSKSISLNIFKPEEAIKPYNNTQTEPITHPGMVANTVAIGPTKDVTMHIIAQTKIGYVDADLVNAVVAIASPYEVFSAPPKKAPTIDPTPSPRRVLSSPGSLVRSVPMIFDRFKWSERCSQNVENATGVNARKIVAKYWGVKFLKPPNAYESKIWNAE